MTSTYPCPHCKTLVVHGTQRCWLCHGGLDPTRTADSEPTAAPDKSWLWVVILASIVLLLIGAQLLVVAPGLLVPYGVVVLPISVALARIAWVGRLDFWNSSARPNRAETAQAEYDVYPRPLEADPPAGKLRAHNVLAGMALVVAIFLGVLALVVLLMVAAVVVFAIVCFASLP